MRILKISVISTTILVCLCQFALAQNEFISIWKSDNFGVSDDDQITIPGVGNYTVEWSDLIFLTSGIVNASGPITLDLPQASTYLIKITGNLEQIQFNGTGDGPKLQSIEQWGNIEWTSMKSAFDGCWTLQVNATDQPDLTNVTDCSAMFRRCFNLNSDLSMWNVISVTNMSHMFESCFQFTTDLSPWKVDNVTDMSFMFKELESFNNNISGWKVNNVTNMRGMFHFALAFDQDLSGWNVSKVTDFSRMFDLATSFDQNINNWTFANGVILDSMFSQAGSFNQNLGGMDLTNVGSIIGMLNNSGLSESKYDSTLIGWSTQNLPMNLELGAKALNYCKADVERAILTDDFNWTITGDQEFCAFITTWKSDNVGSTNNSQVHFPGKGSYRYYWEKIDEPSINGSNSASGQAIIFLPAPGVYRIYASGAIDGFSVDNTNDKLKLISVDRWGDVPWSNNIRGAFSGCANMIYNAQDEPDLTLVTNCSRMFQFCELFDGDVSSWNVSNVVNMNSMFEGAKIFNQDLSLWNVGSVTKMAGLFKNAEKFDQNIGGWVTNNVEEVTSMFEGASAFNQNISGWNMSKVQKASALFKDAKMFNQNIGSWTMPLVVDLTDMFSGAESFNQELSSWNFGNVTDMTSMFNNARQFDQNIGSWDISQVMNMDAMLDNCGLSIEHYDSTIIGWENQAVQSNVNLGAASLIYCKAQSARHKLTSNSAWNISNDAVDLACAFITTWQTDNEGPSPDNNIAIPAIGSFSLYFEEVGNPSNNGSISTLGGFTLNLPNPGTYKIYLTGGLQQFRFDDLGDKNKIISIDHWGEIEWVNFDNSFHGCSNLEYNATDAPNLSIVTDCAEMFKGCVKLNGDLNSWEVDNVEDMRGMFEGAQMFNGNITNWQTGNVKDMSRMFFVAIDFNQDISGWNVGAVENMELMLADLLAFDQNLGQWDVSNVTNFQFMLTATTLSVENYDALLVGWSELDLVPNLSFDGGFSKYCAGQPSKTKIINDFNWTIGDQGLTSDCIACQFVINGDDSGDGSLREALSCIESDTIRFNPIMNNDTVNLSSTSLDLTGDKVIIGLGSQSSYIDASSLNDLLSINSPSSKIELHKLGLITGSSLTAALGINNGILTLRNIDLYQTSTNPTGEILDSGTNSKLIVSKKVTIK